MSPISKLNGVTWAALAKAGVVAKATISKVNGIVKPVDNASIAFLQTADSTTDLSVYTFSSQALGTADSARYIIVSVVGRGSAALQTISSVTVQGITATAIQTQANGTSRASLYVVAVPTGTTGDVVVTWSGTMARMAIGMWRALNITTTAEATGTSTANPQTSTLSVSAGSIQVAIGYSVATSTCTWSGTNGPTEDFDSVVSDASRHSGASGAQASAVTVTATATFTSSTEPCYVSASFAHA